MQKLYTKHYKSQILNTKKVKLNNITYIGFNINDLQNIKLKDKLTLNKTTVVIAHRLSTILNSDKIYVMDKGMVMDSGNHEELLIQSDTYKNYYNKQVNKS